MQKNICPLKQVEEQEIEARKFGFYWEHIDQLIEQVRSECLEVQDAWQKNDRSHLQEEVGDLIQATVSLAVFCGFDPRETLLKSVEKFQKRYDTCVKLVHDDGYADLRDQPFNDVLLSYWKRAKQHQAEL